MKKNCIYIFVFLCFISCKQKATTNTLFQLVPNSGINFTNTVENTKDFNIFSYRNFYNGGGVAIGDVNNDGLADVFFTANMGSNKLYLNKGGFKFDDISEKAGFANKEDWSTGVVMVDINGDGWLDIYVCNAGFINGKAPENKLYINNHDLTFTEEAKQYGLTNNGGYATHAAFFDYDLDGDLDCFIINNSFIPVNTLNYANKRDLRAADWPVADFLKGGGDKLLRNDGGKFTDISKEAHIHGSLISFGLGVTVCDVNGDHYPDVYVSNDFFERDYLYINQKDGTYKDDLENWMQHTSLASMGADVGDVNNDGYPDIFTTDMLPDDDYRLKTTSLFDNIDVYRIKENSGFYHQYMQNTLQLNNKHGKFMDVAFYSGVAASDWSWGGLMLDADNDGLLDLFVCNGIYHDVTNQDFIDFFANDVIQKMVMTGQKKDVDAIIEKMPSYPIANKAFRNNGNLKFTDEGARWGLTQTSFSNGAAYADLDNDGDLDLVVNNVNQPAFVYKNTGREVSKNNYIGFLLKGIGQNTFAIGSTIKVYQGTQVLTREVMPSRGFQSSIDYKTIIGLGNKAVDSVIITWPDRSTIKLDKPAINKVLFVQESNNGKTINDSIVAENNPMFQPAANTFEKHTEDDYVDFYTERGLPMMLSREGPKIAQGDVNGDGLADLYIGGAANQAGQLYVQTTSGFVKKEEPAFIADAPMEDVAFLFFDADKDGDLDLFVGSGGNNHPANAFQMQNRLYLNNGKGIFTKDQMALPNNGMNTSVVVANDFDEDGDEDLFIGSRCIPQNYGPTPASFILLNNGKGKFSVLDGSKSGGIDSVGMVTDAAWANVVGDDKKELIVVGEWMGPRIFSYQNGSFTEVKTNLFDKKGWWQSLAVADMDGDGKEDLVLGNIGENFYLRPEVQSPIKMWMADFDNNGTPEKIITQTIHGKDVPVFLKRDLTDQIASLRKQNLKYEDFARKSIQDLFTPEVLKKCSVKTFDYNSSCIAFNNGNGNFTLQKLPVYVQFSSVNAILCTDVNGDGKKDIIAAGNMFAFQPQFARLDASYGHVLINKGNRQFDYLLPSQSGIEIRGQVKAIAEVKKGKESYLLFTQNDDYPLWYKKRTF